jgi:phosphoenolpyruvate---glycerone phosphotransferase subunit DhaL
MESPNVLLWMEMLSGAVAEHCDRLTQLDSAIGDGDHGINMKRGLEAVVSALSDDAVRAQPPGKVLTVAGRTLVSTVGGASGPLWGSFFGAAGRSAGDVPSLDGATLVTALAAGVNAVQDLGAAVPGDKTMVDALLPGVEALRSAQDDGAQLPQALERAAVAAAEGAHATVPLQARKGRASYLGERSVGHEDPGAASAALVFGALARSVS